MSGDNNNLLTFKELHTVDQAKDLYNRARSTNYVGGSNLCDFLDDYEFEDLLEDVASAQASKTDDDNPIAEYIFIEEYSNKVYGYKKVSVAKEPFIIPDRTQVVVLYVSETCSFSRHADLWGDRMKKIGNKLWDDMISYFCTIYSSPLLIWNMSTENALEHHLTKMYSSAHYDRFLTKTISKISGQNVFEYFGVEEYGFYDGENVLGPNEVFGERNLFALYQCN